MEPENSCKQNRLVHAWRNITSNVVYSTNPPQYPDKQEQCRNCGLVRTFKSRTEKWIEYELREKPYNLDLDNITVSNDLLDINGNGGTTTTTIKPENYI